jgi:lysophospholipase L1-like esterase
VVSLFVLEAALAWYEGWLARRPAPPAQKLELLEPNPSGVGYRMRANLDVTTRAGGRRIRILTNSHGMRWREVKVEKPAGKRRIAVLGDSFAFGCWTDTAENSFAGVFEKNISPAKWEVLNFGVGGFGPADEELQLRDLVLGFSPDYVVVAFYSGNDMRDAYLGVEKAAIVNGTAQLIDKVVRAKVPASDLSDDFVPCPTSPAGAARRLLQRSSTFRLTAPLLGWDDPRIEFIPSRDFTMYTYWSRHSYSQVALAAKDVTLGCFARMESLLAQRGARLAIVAIPYKEQVESRLVAGCDFDVALPQLYVQAFARARGIPYLDLLPLFRDLTHHQNHRLYLPRDTHLNQHGHRVTGEAIADWFRSCVKGGAARR